MGVHGNELADKLAKEATGWRQPPSKLNRRPADPRPEEMRRASTFILRPLIAGRKQLIKRETTLAWMHEWEDSNRATDYKLHLPFPNRSNIKRFKRMKRYES